MVHEQLPVIISTLIKDNMYLQEQCRAKKTLALDIFYTNVTIHTYQIIWSKQLISKLSCILLSHNEPGMYASTVIQDNRYSQEQSSGQHICDILSFFSKQNSSSSRFPAKKIRKAHVEKQKFKLSCDFIDSTSSWERDQCITRFFHSMSSKFSTGDFTGNSFIDLPSKCDFLR